MAHVLVPSKNGRYILQNGSEPESFTDSQSLEKRLAKIRGGELLGIMGSPGQGMFFRAQDLGFQVRRIPRFQLEEIIGESLIDADNMQCANAVSLAWSKEPDAFYTAREVDRQIYLVRELTRVRLALQESCRIPAEQRFRATYHDLTPLLPNNDNLSSLRTVLKNPAVIAGAKADTTALEAQITSLVKGLDIWQALHPDKDDVLPRVLGLGTALGGSLIGEIGDIRRFASADSLKAYARYHVNDGRFPRQQKGSSSNWNDYLNRTMWLWSSEQLVRYPDHVWRQLYDWRKVRELIRHPEPEKYPRADGNGMATRYSLSHLDKRAKRWVGKRLLEYVFDLWSAIARNENPSDWYVLSSWPEYFDEIEHELYVVGLIDRLDSEVARRKAEQAEDASQEE